MGPAARLEAAPFQSNTCGEKPAARFSKLDLAIVVIILVAMAQVLDWTERAAVGGVANLDPAIHVLQFDAWTSVAQFTAQIVANEMVIVNVQPEVVLDSAGDRAGLDFRFRIRWDGQLYRAVHRVQFDG
jgi:hypothetical protein